MNLQAEWRKTLEEHFEVVRVQTMCRMTVHAATMTVDEVLQKFDLGATEHRGEDLTKLDPFDALKAEVKDSFCYVAYAILIGQ